MEYLPAIKIVTDMDAEHVEYTINYAFCCDVVSRVETVGDTKIIHLEHGEVRPWIWCEFYEALEENGSVWISSVKREKVEYDEDGYPTSEMNDGEPFLEYPQEGHWEVCYAEKSNRKLRFSGQYCYWETDEEEEPEEDEEEEDEDEEQVPVVPRDLVWCCDQRFEVIEVPLAVPVIHVVAHLVVSPADDRMGSSF